MAANIGELSKQFKVPDGYSEWRDDIKDYA